LKFFLDNCISPVYADAIAVLAKIQQYDIVHLSQQFDRDTKDVVWIRALSEEPNTVIVSGDPRISRGKAEREAWLESRLTAFFFGEKWASKSFWKQAADLIKWWPEIVLMARKAPRGSGFMVQVSSKSLVNIYTPKG
jgi:hypothetical protein